MQLCLIMADFFVVVLMMLEIELRTVYTLVPH